MLRDAATPLPHLPHLPHPPSLARCIRELRRAAWDPYPFILLNLFLSMLAAIQAPVIMMSQNRQDTKDRLRGELDFEVNRRAESEVQALSRKLNTIVDKIDDVEELLRQRQRQGS